MSNRIDSHFNDFGGIDSRTNEMVQNPKTARDGRNFEFRTDGLHKDFDILAKRRGFQRKAGPALPSDNPTAVGVIRYVYKDINTGEQKVQILGVSSTGILRRLIESEFQITNTSGQTRFYSCFYDETVSLWRIEIRNPSNTLLGTVTFNSSISLQTLISNLNTLSGTTGLTFSSTPSTLHSSILAYFLETKTNVSVPFFSVPTIGYREKVYHWEVVPTPDGTAPFKYIASGNYATNPEFAGISYVNLNNAVYMTDGGFPLKYDGYEVYRAGVPSIRWFRYDASNVSIYATIHNNTGTPWNSGTFHIRGQLRYKDPNGIIHYGAVQTIKHTGYVIAGNTVVIAVTPINQAAQFPVYACKTSAPATLNGVGPFTINVQTLHNIKVGMALRLSQIHSLTRLNSSTIYLRVTAVTATTITLSTNGSGLSLSSYQIQTDQVLNGCYVPENVFGTRENKIGYHSSVYERAGCDVYGMSLVLLTTKGGAGQYSPYYELSFFDVPANGNQVYTRHVQAITNGLLDTLFDEKTQSGSELPRACRYLSSWQGELVQAGRPYDANTLKNQYYPTLWSITQFLTFTDYDVDSVNLARYTESHLCDSQSIYWNDPLYPEGFPQSGLTEESFDTPLADVVTGMGESKDSFFVFKERSMFILNGELATGNIRKERYEVDIGCASHNSIASVSGGLIWLDKTHGFCAVIANQMPKVIGYPVQDWQKTNLFKASADQLKFPTARAVNDLLGDKYLCYVKRESGDLIFVYDYGEKRKCWYIWNGINASGGFIYHDDAVWCAESGFLWKQKKSSSRYDFSDHTSAIPFSYKSAWLNFGLFSIDKKWVQAIIHSVRRGFSVLVSQYYNYIDSKEGEILITFDENSLVSPKRTISLNKLKALSFSLGLENSTINQDVSLNGWEIQFSAEYDKGEAKS